MSTLAERRSQIAEAVKGIGGLIAFDYPPSGDVIVTPAAVVEPEEVDFRARPGSGFRRGGEKWTLSVFLLVASADEQTAARQVDQFFDLNVNDLKNAIEAADKNAFEVTGADRWGEYPIGSQVFAGCRLVVEVLN